MKKLTAASGKANGHEWINTDTALQNTPLFFESERGFGGKRKPSFLVKRKFSLSPKLSPFTLIELLVVIAIIAILAAMLMPALQKAREAAKKADCVSRMKTLGTKFQMYADSQGDWFPYADSGTPKWFSWPMALETSSGRFANLQKAKEHAPSGSSLEWFYKQKYKNVWKDYHCPQQNLMIFESINNLNLGSSVTSYVINGAVLGGPDPGHEDNGLPLKIGKIIKPGTVGLLWDSIIVQPNTSSYISTAVFRATGLDSEAARPGFGLIHADTCNILYTDGHVGNTPRTKRLPIAMTESSPYLVHPTRGRGATNWLLPRN